MGIEPATCCLRNSCSATELHRPDTNDNRNYRSKYFSIQPCLNKPVGVGLKRTCLLQGHREPLSGTSLPGVRLAG
jgi:hypothetical protein